MNNDRRKVLIDKINFEAYGEDRNAEHPFAYKPFWEIKKMIEEWEEQFPGYEDLELRTEQNYVGFGGLYSECYQLVGYPTELAEVMSEDE